jgi:hypothetical protein
MLASASCERAALPAEVARLSLWSATAPAVEGTPVRLTAEVQSATPAAGVIAFAVDGRPLGSAHLWRGAASISAKLPLGRHTVTAVYGGDERHLCAGAALHLMTVPNPAMATLWGATPGAQLSH